MSEHLRHRPALSKLWIALASVTASRQNGCMNPKARVVAFVIALICALSVFAANPVIPEPLRGGISCDETTLAAASVLAKDGWIYVMPKPKSPQAAWGNRDGRTTWWVGYWTNARTKATSGKQPVKGA